MGRGGVGRLSINCPDDTQTANYADNEILGQSVVNLHGCKAAGTDRRS